MRYILVFEGIFIYDSTMRYMDKHKERKVEFTVGDEISVYTDSNGDANLVYHNGRDIEYEEEITPLISVIDSCEVLFQQ